MGFKKKTGKGRLDKYYHYAKEQGYRARSAFKLIQLNKKYDFLSSARCLIDLCAAPGGWLQVATKYMPVESLIVGVDLAPIKPIPQCITFQEDITTPQCRNQLRAHLKTWKADVVLHDGAPNVGSAWAQDAFSQSELVLESLKLAVEFLRKGGIFVTKVFRSKDYNKLMWVFNQLFEKVEATKPPSSRNVSAEIFVVCQGFIAPKKIDPKFLDIKYVFGELDEDAEKGKISGSLNVLEPTKHKRQRDGYADGATTLFKSDDVMNFINAQDPIQYLATINKLEFNSEESKNLLKLNITNNEIQAAIEDLKVLGKKDFRDLLKWRTNILEIIRPKPEAKETSVEIVEESLEDELARLANEEKSKNKKLKRKTLEKRQKDLMKLQLKMTTPVEIGIEQDGISAFSKANEQLNNSKVLNGNMDYEDIIDDSDEDIVLFGGEEDNNEDEEELSDTEVLEANLDAMYKKYKEKRRTKKEALKETVEHEAWYGIKKEEESDSDDSNSDSNVHFKGENFDDDTESESESESDDEDGIKSKKKAGLTGKAALFFDQPIFKEFADDNNENQSSEKNKKRKLIKQESESESEQDEIISDEDLSDGNSDEIKEEDTFSEGDLDDQIKEQKSKELDLLTPEAMTLAIKLANREITKTELINSGFGRFSFNDTDDLPAWFKEDEKKYYKPNIPITKEAAAAIKEKIKALDARPIKKVAEAKARKKYKAAQKLAKLQKKASVIAESTDMTEQEKARSIEKVMAKKGAKKQERKVQLVVARGANRGNKGRPKGVKGRYKMVDPRMKKELRATKRVAKKSAKKRR